MTCSNGRVLLEAKGTGVLCRKSAALGSTNLNWGGFSFSARRRRTGARGVVDFAAFQFDRLTEMTHAALRAAQLAAIAILVLTIAFIDIAFAACPVGEVAGPGGACVCGPGAVPAESVGLNGGGCVCPSGEERWSTVYNRCVYLCPGGTDPRTPQCCKQGQVYYSGKCQAGCPSGQVPSPDDSCCPSGNIVSNGKCVCAPTQLTPGGACCPSGTTVVNGKCAGPCPPQESRNAAGACVPTSCETGYAANASGQCVPVSCPQGWAADSTGTCLPAHCPTGEVPTTKGCVQVAPTHQSACGPGQVLSSNGQCEPVPGSNCPPGEVPGPNGCMH
jgi:hypothetical protein